MVLAVLLTKGHRLLSLAAVVDVFETVNSFLKQEGKEITFDICFVGEGYAFTLPDHLKTYPYVPVEELRGAVDFLFIPAFQSSDLSRALHDNHCFIPFLVEQYGKGASLVSLCTGSFLLAAGGLLDGRQATTHIAASEQFAQAFPKVNLQPHAVITQSEHIYTSGGATSSFHIKLLIIEQCCGREMAIRVAKNFAIDMDRSNQLYFDHFRPALSDEDRLVRAVQVTINERYSEIKNVEEALEEVPSSRRNIIRRFKQATGMTPIRYLQKTKIEAAKQLLETTDKDVLEVMVTSGYQDLKNFRQLFKNFTGMTPKSYREKYGMRLRG